MPFDEDLVGSFGHGVCGRRFAADVGDRAPVFTALREGYLDLHRAPRRHLDFDLSRYTGASLTTIDRHYGHLTKDNRQHAIDVIDIFNRA